ncbi:MAG TPA: hypothetical protein VN764_14070, partial [Polyangiaceae bacterium]|nr:hypothetical protein [Polyangiaceae bacterium]
AGMALALTAGCEAGTSPHQDQTTGTSSGPGSESGGGTAAAGSGGGNAEGAGGAGEESCAHSHCPERLYGKRYLSRGGMAVDDTHIYWCEGVSSEGRFISAAPKDGTGPILTVGTWYDLSSLDALVVDEQHVYWLFPEGTGVLRRVNKDGSDPVSFPLPVHALGGRLDIGPLQDGGDALFIATHGCFQIVRVPKDGSDPQLWEVSDLGNGGGVTAMGVQGQYVYCSNDDYIQRLDTATGEVALVVDDQRSGSPFVLIDQYLYVHANQPSVFVEPYIGRIDLSADKPTTVNLGPSFATSSGLFYDTERRRLYWTTGLSPTDAHVGTYALDGGGPPELLFDKQDVYGGAAMDEEYLYWMGGTGLRRLKKW